MLTLKLLFFLLIAVAVNILFGEAFVLPSSSSSSSSSSSCSPRVQQQQQQQRSTYPIIALQNSISSDNNNINSNNSAETPNDNNNDTNNKQGNGNNKEHHYYSGGEENEILPGPDDTTEEHIRSLFSLFNNALATGSPKLVAKRYSKDAVLLPSSNGDALMTEREIEEFYEDYLPTKPQKRIVDGRIRIGHGWAEDAGICEISIQDLATGMARKVKARYVSLIAGFWLRFFCCFLFLFLNSFP
jgi:hypothetical protein